MSMNFDLKALDEQISNMPVLGQVSIYPKSMSIKWFK